MNARKTSVEKFRYTHAELVEASRLLPEMDRALVVRRLSNRETWSVLADAWGCGAFKVKASLRRHCLTLCEWIDQKNGRGIIPPKRTRLQTGLFKKKVIVIAPDKVHSDLTK